LLALLGFAAATQIRLTHRHDSYAGQPRENLVALLDSLSAAADRAQVQINQLQHTRSDLLSSSQRRDTALEEARKRLDVLHVLAGTAPAEGPGVTITITDPVGAVSSASILNGIEELRDAGAEAIEINNRLRVVASTAFTESGGAVLVDGVQIQPPYVIDAIGSSHTLSEAVRFPGGLADEIKQLGGSVSVKEADQVRVQSLHPVQRPEYAQPTGG
jgi:uncharacterized protein YlxW (UPF0749 family)